MFLKGSIEIKTISGRRGAFNVGLITTPIGTFEAKSALLDAFDAGRYDGHFDVAQIYIDHYRAGNHVVSKLCAEIHDLHIDNDDGQPERPLAEQASPADAPAPAAPLATLLAAPVDGVVEAGFVPDPTVDDPAPTPAPSEALDGVDADIELFGDEAYSALKSRMPIELDTAASAFRRQVKRLKELGYTYRGAERVWVHL